MNFFILHSSVFFSIILKVLYTKTIFYAKRRVNDQGCKLVPIFSSHDVSIYNKTKKKNFQDDRKKDYTFNVDNNV